MYVLLTAPRTCPIDSLLVWVSITQTFSDIFFSVRLHPYLNFSLCFFLFFFSKSVQPTFSLIPLPNHLFSCYFQFLCQMSCRSLKFINDRVPYFGMFCIPFFRENSITECGNKQTLKKQIILTYIGKRNKNFRCFKPIKRHKSNVCKNRVNKMYIYIYIYIYIRCIYIY